MYKTLQSTFGPCRGTRLRLWGLWQESKTLELLWLLQEGYEVALFEGLNGEHSSKAQLLLGVPAEMPHWNAVLQALA